MYTTVVQPLLTDLYQITMAYGYWKCGKHNQDSVFELFFRKNPFQGEFTVFCGLQDVIMFLDNFHISDEDIDYLKSILPTAEPGFFEYLQNLDTKQLKLYSQREGSVVFPRVPLICVEGPLALCQLVETTILTLVNYASLVATNSVRYRLAAGSDKTLLEFGLRRAQGPDGGLTASRYCYVGGFDASSNVLAGKMYGIPVRGTHAHSFVNAFTSLNDLTNVSYSIKTCDGKQDFNLLDKTKYYSEKLKSETHEGELAAFIAYAASFPNQFLVLIDTYSSLQSGVTNFLAVALALNDAGYKARGVRLDSGDLAYQSNIVYQRFCEAADTFNVPWFKDSLEIVASNDIDEEILFSIKNQEHKITSFGIGTNLVTCSSQPALGCVYKIVEIEGKPCMKLAQDLQKLTIPGKKQVYRLFGSHGTAVLDLVATRDEEKPIEGHDVLCRDPFHATKRAFCCPTKVETLLKLVWGENGPVDKIHCLKEIKSFVSQSLNSLRPDVKRKLNPTPYKVSLTNNLYEFLHKEWLENAPIGKLDC